MSTILKKLARQPRPLLKKMRVGGHRMTGVVAAILLLALALTYLLGRENAVPTQPAAVTGSGDELPTVDAGPDAGSGNVPGLAAAEAEPADGEGLRILPDSDTPLTPEEEAELVAALRVTDSAGSDQDSPATTSGIQASAPDEVADTATEATVTEREADSKEAEGAGRPEPAAVAAAKPAKTARPEAGATETAAAEEPTAAEDGSETQRKFISPSDLPLVPPTPAGQSPAAAAEPAAEQTGEAVDEGVDNSARDTAGEPAPETGRVAKSEPYLTPQGSLAILTRARFLYLTGEAPLAIEQLGLAINAGHIHPDYHDAFKDMKRDITDLLALYRTVQKTEDEKFRALSLNSFLQLEEKVFPGEVSTYEAKLTPSQASEPEGAAGQPPAGESGQPPEDQPHEGPQSPDN